MTGYDDFNFPLFYKVTDELRTMGFKFVSPAEEDRKRGIDHNKEGDASKLKQTWGEILAYDVQLIADTGIEGIVFLPNWEKSKGARLEAFVGLNLKNFKFFEWKQDKAVEISSLRVLSRIYIYMETETLK